MTHAMADNETILRHPPAHEVKLEVNFPNNLAVADGRSRFYNLVRGEFPTVIIPEQGKMQFDFGDYALYTENLSLRLEVGMSYFRAVSTGYPGFTKFRDSFSNALQLFIGCYDLKTFNNFALTYVNKLQLEPEHRLFEDIFRLEVKIPEDLGHNLFAGKGLLVFQKPEGYMTVQFDPEAGAGGVGSYSLTLFFVSFPGAPINAEKGPIESLANVAHGYLSKFFFGILTEKYLAFLRAK